MSQAMTRVISRELLKKKLGTQKVLDQLYRAFIDYMTRHTKVFDPKEEERINEEVKRLSRELYLKPCPPPSPEERHAVTWIEGELIWLPVAQVYILNTLRELVKRYPDKNEIVIERDILLQIFDYRKFSEGLADQANITDVRGRVAESATIEALLGSDVFRKPKTLLLSKKEILFWRF